MCSQVRIDTPVTHSVHASAEVLPVVVILDQEAQEHAGIEARHWHLANSITMKGGELFCGGGRRKPGFGVLARPQDRFCVRFSRAGRCVDDWDRPGHALRLDHPSSSRCTQRNGRPGEMRI